jgi:hypothetical protein
VKLDPGTDNFRLAAAPSAFKRRPQGKDRNLAHRRGTARPAAAAVGVRPSARRSATEIQHGRVKFLRHGETRGDYLQVVATPKAADPHSG